MRTDKFKKWLLEERALNFRSAQSRISNCRTVERTYSDLDKQFLKDKGQSLMELLTYSTKDQRNRLPAKHSIPIDGNIKNGSATLKSAVVLYMKFCEDERKNGKHSETQPKLEIQMPELKSEKSLEGYNSIIKNNQTNISYKKLFGDFLEEATEYVVRDPYIRFPYQLKNFNELCHLIGETKHNGERVRIHLITNKNDEFLENTKKSFEEMISSLSNQGIELSYEFSDILHDRSIEMNNGWKIVLGRGLDIWHKYGRFDSAENNQEKRLCKEFEITIVKITIPNLIKQEFINDYDGELIDAIMDELEIEIISKVEEVESPRIVNKDYAQPKKHFYSSTVLPIELNPNDEATFKRKLLHVRRAFITTIYADGRQEKKPWNAMHFKETSGVIGNLRSRPEFRNGEWQKRGIIKVFVSIEE